MVPSREEAARPDRVPLHRRGWGRGAHPLCPGFFRVILAVSLELFVTLPCLS